MYILAPKMDKSLPFEKVQTQWQILYLFFFLRVKNLIKSHNISSRVRNIFNLISMAVFQESTLQVH